MPTHIDLPHGIALAVGAFMVLTSLLDARLGRPRPWLAISFAFVGAAEYFFLYPLYAERLYANAATMLQAWTVLNPKAVTPGMIVAVFTQLFVILFAEAVGITIFPLAYQAVFPDPVPVPRKPSAIPNAYGAGALGGPMLARSRRPEASRRRSDRGPDSAR